MNKKGFTLIEIVAVITVVAIIAVIAVTSVNETIRNSTKNTFAMTTKNIISTIRTEKAKNNSLDVESITVENMQELLNIPTENYESISIGLGSNSNIIINIVGKGKWENLNACGVFNDLTITDGVSCETKYVVPTPEVCFVFDSDTKTITDYDEANCSKDVVIPRAINDVNVEHIGAFAFANNQLTSLNLTDLIGLITIEENAFFNNQITNLDLSSLTNLTDLDGFSYNQLASLIIPGSVINIANGAFYNNHLTSVTIPNSVITIGDEAFQFNYINNLIIPNNVITIGDSAFSVNQLSTLTIGTGLTVLSPSVFHNNQLTSVIIPDNITFIGHNAFQSNELTSINIPDSVTTIDYSAFLINKLTNITIPSSVTSIGSAAFTNNLLPDDQAFIYGRNGDGSIDYTVLESYGGAKKSNVLIPAGVTRIESSAFALIQLASVTIPNTVTSIGQWTFGFGLMTSLIIPESVTTIENNAFYNSVLTSLTIQGADPQRFNSSWANIGFPSNLMP